MEDANSSRTVDGDKTPGWASGLKLRGVYYEGYTDNLQRLLNQHSSCTITTYGVRRSRSCSFAEQSSLKAHQDGDDKENDVGVQVRVKIHFIFNIANTPRKIARSRPVKDHFTH